MARLIGSDVILADLDMAFGTAGLDFNLDPPQGIAEAVFGADRLDEVLLDRLLAKCEDHLSLLAAPAALDKAYDFGEAAFDQMLEIVQSNVPTVVLDVPHTMDGLGAQDADRRRRGDRSPRSPILPISGTPRRSSTCCGRRGRTTRRRS